MFDPEAAKAVAEIPWGEVIVGSGAILAALGAAFGVMFRALMNSHARETVALKMGWKQAIRAQRYARVELEQQEGTPSVRPPPLRDEEYEDDTGIHEAMLREDERFFAERKLRIKPGLPERPPLDAFVDHLSRNDRRLNDTDRELRKFTSDGESTPPAAFRPKFPSRRG